MPEIRIIGDGVVIEQLDPALDETVRLCCYRDPIACNCPPARRQRKAMELEALSVAQMTDLCRCMRLLVRAYHVSAINLSMLSSLLRDRGWTMEDS